MGTTASSSDIPGPDTRPDTGTDARPDGGVVPMRGMTDTGPDTGPVVLTGRVVATGGQARPAVRVRAVAVAGSSRDRLVGLVRDERTRGVARFVARHAVFVPAGALVVGRRAWEARSTSRFERMMRAAEASGNVELLNDWQQRGELFKAARHDRLMTWLHAPAVIARGLAVGFTTVVFALLGVGALLASARSDWGAVLVPLQAAVMAVNAVVVFVGACWEPFWRVVPWVVVAALWHQGRTRGPLPSWLATASEADVDVLVDERTIARALLALRLPAITAALKVAPLQFLTTARKEGRGTYAVVRLPAGVTAERITKRRADLATGLYRRAGEVWPTTGTEEGILQLWVADKGALADGAGPYPLLDAGLVDVFKGVPFGRTLRGDPVVAPLIGRNSIIGGMPDQGKSSGARVLVAGAALDPTVELRIWVPDANFDFEAFKPRCSRYVMGAEDTKVEQIVADLRDLDAEVQKRGQLLVDHEVASVTRDLANRGIGLHPLVCLLEEAHVVFQHPTYGAEAQQLAANIVKLCRKRGIHLIISTQAPTATSVPRDVTRNCSNGIAFAVADHVANDGLLGEGAYKSGHRATELMPGTDRGTAVVRGLGGSARSETVQVYFLDINNTNDQITPIIARSLKALKDKNRPVPGAGRALSVVPARRDLLTDLAEVLPDTPTPTADVPALLARSFPGWAPYRALTGKTLRAVLEADHGLKVPSTGNRYPLDAITIRDAITERDRTDRPDENTGDTAS